MIKKIRMNESMDNELTGYLYAIKKDLEGIGYTITDFDYDESKLYIEAEFADKDNNFGIKFNYMSRLTADKLPTIQIYHMNISPIEFDSASINSIREHLPLGNRVDAINQVINNLKKYCLTNKVSYDDFDSARQSVFN
jgi:hypothetical protein